MIQIKSNNLWLLQISDDRHCDSTMQPLHLFSYMRYGRLKKVKPKCIAVSINRKIKNVGAPHNLSNFLLLIFRSAHTSEEGSHSFGRQLNLKHKIRCRQRMNRVLSPASGTYSYNIIFSMSLKLTCHCGITNKEV